MPAMNQVARRAGVSVSTVSYALSGARPISEQAWARLAQAMAEPDFRPNALARGLAGRRSRVLGLIYPPINRPIGATELIFITSINGGIHLVDIDFRQPVLRGVEYLANLGHQLLQIVVAKQLAADRCHPTVERVD